MSDALKDTIADYYSQKLAMHGPTPMGVDWSDAASQHRRFEQLCKLINKDSPCSVLDYGCGYAALYEFLTAREYSISYLGFDWSEEMAAVARERLPSSSNISIVSGPSCEESRDYVLASGILNVRLNFDTDQWHNYVLDTISILNKLSTKGFAFNCLTSYSDPDRMRSDLYYGDPLQLFDHCKRKYSKNVALLHDYDLYEFTIIVRK